jgi:hypothetical protein
MSDIEGIFRAESARSTEQSIFQSGFLGVTRNVEPQSGTVVQLGSLFLGAKNSAGSQACQ